MSSPLPTIRRAMGVKRYHQEFTHVEDTVARHSAGVALIVHLIHPNASKELILATLSHDLGEIVTGDIPAPSKRAISAEAKAALDKMEETALVEMGFPQANDLSKEDHLVLKLADYLEGLCFVTEEVRRGNRALIHVGHNYSRYLDLLITSIPSNAIWRETAVLYIVEVSHNWGKVSNER